MYQDADRRAAQLESENAAARQTVEEQRQRLAALMRERQLLGSGEAVPAWVVAGMDNQIGAVEQQRDALQAEVSRLQATVASLLADRAALCALLLGDGADDGAELSVDEVRARHAALEEARARECAHAAARRADEDVEVAQVDDAEATRTAAPPAPPAEEGAGTSVSITKGDDGNYQVNLSPAHSDDAPHGAAASGAASSAAAGAPLEAGGAAPASSSSHALGDEAAAARATLGRGVIVDEHGAPASAPLRTTYRVRLVGGGAEYRAVIGAARRRR